VTYILSIEVFEKFHCNFKTFLVILVESLIYPSVLEILYVVRRLANSILQLGTILYSRLLFTLSTVKRGGTGHPGSIETEAKYSVLALETFCLCPYSSRVFRSAPADGAIFYPFIFFLLSSYNNKNNINKIVVTTTTLTKNYFPGYHSFASYLSSTFDFMFHKKLHFVHSLIP